MFINEPSHYDASLDRTGRTIDKERGVSLVRLSGGGERPDLFALIIGDRRIAFEAIGHRNDVARAIEWEVIDIGQACIWYGSERGETLKIHAYLFANMDEYERTKWLIDESLNTYTLWNGIVKIPVLSITHPNSTKRLKT
jgi:hypothetical protein